MLGQTYIHDCQPLRATPRTLVVYRHISDPIWSDDFLTAVSGKLVFSGRPFLSFLAVVAVYGLFHFDIMFRDRFSGLCRKHLSRFVNRKMFRNQAHVDETFKEFIDTRIFIKRNWKAWNTSGTVCRFQWLLLWLNKFNIKKVIFV